MSYVQELYTESVLTQIPKNIKTNAQHLFKNLKKFLENTAIQIQKTIDKRVKKLKKLYKKYTKKPLLLKYYFLLLQLYYMKLLARKTSLVKTVSKGIQESVENTQKYFNTTFNSTLSKLNSVKGSVKSTLQLVKISTQLEIEGLKEVYNQISTFVKNQGSHLKKILEATGVKLKNYKDATLEELKEFTQKIKALIKKGKIPLTQTEQEEVKEVTDQAEKDIKQVESAEKKTESFWQKIKTQLNKLVTKVKEIAPGYKLAGSLATSLIAYSLLVVKLKRVGLNISPINIVNVFKGAYQLITKGSLADKLITISLSILAILGIGAAGYYGYIVIKNYFENRKNKK